MILQYEPISMRSSHINSFYEHIGPHSGAWFVWFFGAGGIRRPPKNPPKPNPKHECISMPIKAIFKRFNAFYCLYGANVPFKRYATPTAHKMAFLRAFNTAGLHAYRINQSAESKKGSRSPPDCRS